jgi:hypothetical protein
MARNQGCSKCDGRRDRRRHLAGQQREDQMVDFVLQRLDDTGVDIRVLQQF